jgi:hypothetical protein
VESLESQKQASHPFHLPWKARKAAGFPLLECDERDVPARLLNARGNRRPFRGLISDSLLNPQIDTNAEDYASR